MKAGRKKQVLTEKEQVLMQMLWERGPMLVREIVDAYPEEPVPHFNTVATTLRILEDKGFVGHNTLGGSHQFYAILEKTEVRNRSIADVVRNFFDNSYKNAVSALVENEKLSVEELKEIISIIESNNKKQ